MAENSRRDALAARLEQAASLRASVGGPPLNDAEKAELEAQHELDLKRARIDPALKSDLLIRDAMARGEFDNLKYAGKPIPGLDGNHDPDWWIKGLIQRENLQGVGPEAIILRMVDKELQGTLDRLPSEAQVREALEEFNKRVINARRQLQGGPPVVTPTREVDAEVAAWRSRRAAAVVREEEQQPTTPEPRRRLFGRRRRGGTQS